MPKDPEGTQDKSELGHPINIVAPIRKDPEGTSNPAPGTETKPPRTK